MGIDMKTLLLFMILTLPVLADKILSVTLTDAKWTTVKQAMLASYPKPHELTDAGVSDQKWIEKLLKMYLIDITASYDQRVRQDSNNNEKNAVVGEP